MPSFFVNRPLGEAVLILLVTLLAMAVIAVVSYRVPSKFLLAAGLVLAAFQGFVPFSYISWFLLAGLALLPVAVRRSGGFGAFKNPWLALLTALALVQAASALWSPTIGAVAHSVLAVVVLGVFFLLWRVESVSAASMTAPLLIAAPVYVLFAILVIWFRFDTSAEMNYLLSPLAPYLSEPGVELISDGRWLNVFDPAKSGGPMLNGNIASLFLALVAVLYGWAATYASQWKRWSLAGVCALAVLGAFATGSKTPLLLAVATPVIALAVLAASRGRQALTRVLVAAGAIITGAVLAAAATGFLGAAADTLITRSAYWQLAGIEFPAHWLLGLGFGGWELSMQEHWVLLYGEDYPYLGFPPHNFLLQAWADAGILHVALTATIAALPIILMIRAIARAGERRLWSDTSLRDGLLLSGLIWAPAHALTDTTTFFGDNHTVPLYAALVALAVNRYRSVSSNTARVRAKS